MDSLHFKHIGHSSNTSTGTFPRQRASNVTPSLLSRMSYNDREGVAVADDEAASVTPDQATRLLHKRIESLSAGPSLVDRLGPSPSAPSLHNRISNAEPSPTLQSRISGEPLRNRISLSPTVPARKILQQSTVGPATFSAQSPTLENVAPASISVVQSQNKASVPSTPLTAGPRSNPNMVTPAAPAASKRVSEGQQRSAQVDVAVPVPAIQAVAPSSSISTSNLHTSVKSARDQRAFTIPSTPTPNLHLPSRSSISAPARPFETPSHPAPRAPLPASRIYAIQNQTGSQLFPTTPYRMLFPPSKHDTPSPNASSALDLTSSPSTPSSNMVIAQNKAKSSTLAFYLTPVWAESAAQMQEWAEVASSNERARDTNPDAQPDESAVQVGGAEGGVPAENSDDVQVKTDAQSEASAGIEATPTGKKRARGEEHAREVEPDSKRTKVSAPGPDLPVQRQDQLDRSIADVPRTSVYPSSPMSISESEASPLVQRIVVRTQSTRREFSHEIEGGSSLENQTQTQEDDIETGGPDPETLQDDDSSAAALEEEEPRATAEAQDREAEIRKRHLERELAFHKREEEERARIEKARVRLEQERERAEQERIRLEQERKQREETELREREKLLRDAMQKRKMEKTSQVQATASHSNVSPPIVPTQTAQSDAAPIVSAHTPAVPVIISAQSPMLPSQGLQHPLPPRPSPLLGDIALKSVKSIPLGSTTSPAPARDKITPDVLTGSELSSSPTGSSQDLGTRPTPVSGTNMAPSLASPISSAGPLTHLPPIPAVVAVSKLGSTSDVTTSQPAPSQVFNHTVAVKQEATEPQLPLIQRVASADAPAARARVPVHELIATTAPSTASLPNNGGAAPPSHAPPTQGVAPSLDHGPKATTSQDCLLLESATNTPLPSVKTEPKSEVKLEPWSLSSMPTCNVTTAIKRPLSPSLAASVHPVVKKRRDSSPATDADMELKYPDAASEASGWGQADLDQDEEERRPGGRYRRTRTKTPEDVLPALRRCEASPDLARTPPRPLNRNSRSRSRSRSTLRRYRSRSRSPVRTGRLGRGRPPTRGPRGRGRGRPPGRVIGDWSGYDRYGSSRARSTSRSPPRHILPSRSPPRHRQSRPFVPRMVDHWSLAARPVESYATNNPPSPPNQNPAGGRGGRREPNTHLPRYDVRHEPRTPPRESTRLPHSTHDRHCPPYTQNTLPENVYNEPPEKQIIPPHLAPGPPNSRESCSVSGPSSRPLSGQSSFMRGRGAHQPAPARFASPENDRPRPPPINESHTQRRTVSASSAQIHLASVTDDAAPAPPTGPSFNYAHQAQARSNNPPSLLNRISQGQRPIANSGEAPYRVAAKASGIEPGLSRGGGPNLRGHGRGRGGAPPGRPKLASRITNAPAGDS